MLTGHVRHESNQLFRLWEGAGQPSENALATVPEIALSNGNRSSECKLMRQVYLNPSGKSRDTRVPWGDPLSDHEEAVCFAGSYRD